MDKYICAEKGHSFEMIRIDPEFPHGCISGICKSTCRICGKEEWSYETTGCGCPVEVSEKCSCGCRVYYVDSMMEKISLFVEENTEAEIFDEEREIR